MRFFELEAVWVFVLSDKWTGGHELRRRIRNDLDCGVAPVTVIQSVSTIEVAEVEDEGLLYISENTRDTVILSGQEMEQHKRKQFLLAKIGVIKAPRSEIFLGLIQTGGAIPIDRRVPPFAYDIAKKTWLYGQFFRNFRRLKEMNFLGSKWR